MANCVCENLVNFDIHRYRDSQPLGRRILYGVLLPISFPP